MSIHRQVVSHQQAVQDIPLVDQLDNVLPQTQCGKCGHGGCRPYAEAMAAGEIHTKCPPGGQQALVALAHILKRPTGELEQPAESPRLAIIREDECIGCTKCIQACPVDAIVGAAKQMHGVLENECTGCELCVAPCPVDCIDIVDHPLWLEASNTEIKTHYLQARAAMGRQRFKAHNLRVEARKEALQLSRMERLKKRLTRPDQEKEALVDSSPHKHEESGGTAVKPPSSIQDQRLPDKSGKNAAQPLSPVQAAKIARLQHKLARLDEDAPQRAVLQQQLQDIQGSGSTSATLPSRQLKMALAAAEQRRRMAERHLKHCERQCGPVEVKAAKAQLQQALEMEEEARQALK